MSNTTGDNVKAIKLALCPALRQLKHNDGSEGFVVAYDYEWINDYVLRLQAELAERDRRYEQTCDDWNYEAAIRKEVLQKANERIAELESAKASAVSVPIEIISFLKGENEFDNIWFGECHPKYKGKFWWRRFLSAGDPINKPESSV